MSRDKIINLAGNLAAAYKEIPYSLLGAFLKDASDRFPHDRVLQHMDAIIEKRAEQYPLGYIYVKDLDALIAELASFGDTERARHLFSAYLGKIKTASDNNPRVSREVMTEDARALSEVKEKQQTKTASETPMQKTINDIPIDKIMSDYKVSTAYNKEKIGLGANIVNRALTAAFGASPSSVTFNSDIKEGGVIYDATVVTPLGRVDVRVPIKIGSFGFHTPDVFMADVDGKEVVYQLNSRTARGFLSKHQTEKSAEYDPNFVNASYKELHAAVMKRAAKQDHRGAEEAISLIQKKYPTMVKAALADYQSVLMLFAKAESKQHCASCVFYCPAGAKTASVHDYCNRLGRPVNEIIKYADPNKCELVSREAKRSIAGFEGKITSHNIKIV